MSICSEIKLMPFFNLYDKLLLQISELHKAINIVCGWVRVVLSDYGKSTTISRFLFRLKIVLRANKLPVSLRHMKRLPIPANVRSHDSGLQHNHAQTCQPTGCSHRKGSVVGEYLL